MVLPPPLRVNDLVRFLNLVQRYNKILIYANFFAYFLHFFCIFYYFSHIFALFHAQITPKSTTYAITDEQPHRRPSAHKNRLPSQADGCTKSKTLNLKNYGKSSTGY